MRSPLLYIAWTHVGGRSAEIAASLGGEARNVYFPALKSGWRVPLRYVLSAVVTVGLLLRHRPRSVIVTNPPIFPAMFVWLWCLVSGAPFVLDSHPASFGLKDNRIAAFFLPVHRFLARRSAGVAVTTDALGDVVRGWGADPLLVHEAPPLLLPEHTSPADGAPSTPTVFFVCTFAPDEPWREVLEAAASLPGVRVQVTGRPEKVDADTRAALPDTVELVGFLGQDDYLAHMAASTLVLSLTTEPESVMRSAYEAVYLQRPLMVTDTEALREVFPYARLTQNDAASLAEAITAALDQTGQLDADAELALECQTQRWDDQHAELRRRLVEPMKEHS